MMYGDAQPTASVFAGIDAEAVIDAGLTATVVGISSSEVGCNIQFAESRNNLFRFSEVCEKQRIAMDKFWLYMAGGRQF
jgi:hypothetical protein